VVVGVVWVGWGEVRWLSWVVLGLLVSYAAVRVLPGSGIMGVWEMVLRWSSGAGWPCLELVGRWAGARKLGWVGVVCAIDTL
jgi:hypothetical protein